MFAVADLAGGDWGRRIRDAQAALAGRAAERTTDRDRPTELLIDCRRVFDEAGCPFMPSVMMDGALHAMDDRPWNTYGRGRTPITAHQRAALLRRFGIQRSKDAKDVRGYFRADFAKAWDSYVPLHQGSVGTVGTVGSSINVDGASDRSDRSDRSLRETAPAVFSAPRERRSAP